MDHDGVVPEAKWTTRSCGAIRTRRSAFDSTDAVVSAFADAVACTNVVLVEASDLQRAAYAGGGNSATDRAATEGGIGSGPTCSSVFRILRKCRTARFRAPDQIPPGTTMVVSRSPRCAQPIQSNQVCCDQGRAVAAGIVYLTDVAPTVLDLFGIARPTHMEGEVMEVHLALAVPRRIESIPSLTPIRGVVPGALVLPASILVVVLGVALALMTALALLRQQWRRGAVGCAVRARVSHRDLPRCVAAFLRTRRRMAIGPFPWSPRSPSPPDAGGRAGEIRTDRSCSRSAQLLCPPSRRPARRCPPRAQHRVRLLRHGRDRTSGRKPHVRPTSGREHLAGGVDGVAGPRSEDHDPARLPSWQ